MQSIEIQAKSVEEATRSAAEKLGVPTSDLSVTVIEQSKGLFGKSAVRIRAEVVAKAAASKSAVVEAKAPAASPAEKPARGRAKAKTKEEPAAPAVVAPPVPEPVAAAAPAKPARGRGKAKPTEEPAAAPAESEGPTERVEAVATQEDAERLLALAKTLLDSSGMELSVKVGQVSGRYVSIELDGKDAAFLVGKHGEVLNAMQYLINIVAGRRFNNGVRTTLDGNDYRRRREEALESLAQKIADQVKERGEEAVLDALPAFERRIVHKVLSTYEGVSTYSEGEEPNRRVVIAPAD